MMELFSVIAQVYGPACFEFFEPLMDKFDHKVDEIIKENKYLLPHLVTGLIHGSYNWPKETREKLYTKCLPYFQKGWEVSDKKLYQMWLSGFHFLIKGRDINLYKALLDKTLLNPYETEVAITRRRRINRYVMIQYFGKENCEPYRQKLLKDLETAQPLDTKELIALSADVILPCLQNSSVIPIYYPAIKELGIKDLEKTIKDNPDEY